MKLGFPIVSYAKRNNFHIASIPMKDGSSVKILTDKIRNGYSMQMFNIKDGHLININAYKGHNPEEIGVFIERVQNFAQKGVDVFEEIMKSLRISPKNL